MVWHLPGHTGIAAKKDPIKSPQKALQKEQLSNCFQNRLANPSKKQQKNFIPRHFCGWIQCNAKKKKSGIMPGYFALLFISQLVNYKTEAPFLIIPAMWRASLPFQ